MQKSRIAPHCLQQILDSASNASVKGQAQYFTPPEWASVLSVPLPKHRPTIIDLQCGSGNLLEAAMNRSTKYTLGCDVDLPSTDDCRVAADVTLFYPLLKQVNFAADLFVLNPPWDLHWHRERLAALAESELISVRTAFNALDPRISSSQIDSTVATLCMALDCSSVYGEGFLIANAATMERLIFAENAPHHALAAHVWFHLIVHGNICAPDAKASDFKTSVIYWARSHTKGQRQLHQHCDNLNSAREYLTALAHHRDGLRLGAEVRYTHVGMGESDSDVTHKRWTAAGDEWNRLHSNSVKPSTYNLKLAPDGTIVAYLSLFDDFTGRIPKDFASKLNELNGKHPMQLVIQRAHRKALEKAIAPGSPFRVAPELIAAVQNAVAEYNAVRAPLYPLPTIQRLGYLDEQDDIVCTRNLHCPHDSVPMFRAGERYAIRSTTVRVRRAGQKRNNAGELDDVEYDGQELAFYIQSRDHEWCFMDVRLRDKSTTTFTPKPWTTRKNPRKIDPETDGDKVRIDFTLQQLVDHFDIPEVPDVAILHPERFQGYLRILAEIEAMFPQFKFKPFQREDLARAAIHDGLILGHDTGLGKTVALYVWACLKLGLIKGESKLIPKGAVLHVVPGDGHDQHSDEGQLHFRTRPTRIDSQATFLRLSSLSPKGQRTLPNGFYLTSYTQLADNGVLPFPKLDTSVPRAMMQRLNLTDAGVKDFFDHRGDYFRKQYQTLESAPDDPLATVRARYFRLRRDHVNDQIRNNLDAAFAAIEHITPARKDDFSSLTQTQLHFIRQEFVTFSWHAFSHGIGEIRRKTVTKDGKEVASFSVKCVYSPSLADLSQTTFDCVCVDEGTKIKGEETIIGRGVRQMSPRFRIIATATPIKNRLPDIFRLAWWASGAHEDPHPRFPYGDDTAQRDEFAEEFLVSERNLSAEDRDERPRVKLTPQVCNVHKLWKLFAPIVLRRRKHACGEQIVAKHRHVIRVPMGKHQSLVYRYHLEAKYKDKNDRPAIGPKLQALRIAAANPASGLLEEVPGSRPKNGLIARSSYSYTPKLAAVLSKACDIIKERQQAIIFGAFYDSLDPIGTRLAQAGIPYLTLDGRLTQARRGKLAAQFKRGPASGIPICLAGVECMAELHSFNKCLNAILLAYSWAWDKFEQAINRIHRLNSIADVNVWSIFCDGTIDRKLEGLIQEKGDASELVLDGKLLGENSAEVNLADILYTANLEFNPQDQTIDEKALEEDWPQLRASLAAAWRHWNSLPARSPAKEILPDSHAPAAPTFAPVPLSARPTSRSVAPEAPRNRPSSLPQPSSAHFDDLPLWQLTTPWRRAA